MVTKLPRSLIAVLAITAAFSFALSMYLENYRLVYLQNRPISVNLISGVVGFSTAALVVSIGFNWWKRRSEGWHFNRALVSVDAVMPDLHALLREMKDARRQSPDDMADFHRRMMQGAETMLAAMQRLKWNGLLATKEAKDLMASLHEQAGMTGTNAAILMKKCESLLQVSLDVIAYFIRQVNRP